MKNLQKTFWNQRIPPYFSIFILILSFATILWLSSNAILTGTKAALGTNPKNVQVSNITDTSFTVSYTTDDEVVGTLKYTIDETDPTAEDQEEPELDKIVLDDRDKQEGKPLPHRVHHITIENLEASKKYLYSITSSDQEFFNKDGKPYDITTGPALGTPTSQDPVEGKVALYDGMIPTEGIVYLTDEKAQLLSVLLKPDGSYTLPLTGIREKDFKSYLSLTADTKLKMLITNSLYQSNVAFLVSQTTSPLPQVILPKDYDFVGASPLTPSPTPRDDSFPASDSAKLTPSPDASSSGLPTPEITPGTELELITPKDDQEFQEPQPTFRGKAAPNTTIDIRINAEEEVITSVVADENGIWQFRPSKRIEPGIHAITVSAPDSTGETQTITRSFTIKASGSQFLEPSVKANTPTPTPEPPTPTVEPTATPIPTAEPSPTPTIMPTATSIPTAIPTIGPDSGIGSPDNGNGTVGTVNSPTPMVTRPPLAPTGSSAVMIGIGAVLLSIGIGAILLFAL